MIRRAHATRRVTTNRRRGLIGVVAGAMVAATALTGLVGAGPASASSDDGGAITGDLSNLIIIKTGGESNFAKRYGPNGLASPAEATQPLTGAKSTCLLTSNDTAVIFTSSPANSVALKGGSIGVNGGVSGGQCNQVSGDETLSLKLAAGKFADLAVLDIEVQKNVVVRATAYSSASGTEQPAGTWELRSGTSVTGLPSGNVANCNGGATSSGPNSNSSDNCRWVLAGSVFDRIELRAVGAGQFSLEGGSDGATIATASPGVEQVGRPKNVSYFVQTIPCTPTNSQVSFGGSGTPTGSVTRGTNADGTGCEFTPVTVDSTPGQLTLTKSGTPYSQFIVNVTWTANLNELAKVTTVNFGGPDLPMVLCPIALRNASTGALEVLDSTDVPVFSVSALNVLGITDMDGNANTPLQYSCSGARVPAWNPTTQNFTVTEQIYLIGDVVWRG